MRVITLGLFALIALLANTANAYTPESGMWGNFTEPGSGMTIEIQDNWLGLTFFTGDAQGRPLIYTSQGLLTGNDRYTGRVRRVDRIPCFGCAGSSASQDAGQITITFDPYDNTKGTLTWLGGLQIPIYRLEFWYKLAADEPNVPQPVTKMLGEWSLIVDLSINGEYPYSGDVLLLEDYEWDADLGVWFFVGCRAGQSMNDGQCTQFDNDYHDATGFFDPDTGEQVIIVKDGWYCAIDSYDCQSSPDRTLWYALYEVVIGTESGSGCLTLFADGTDAPTNCDYDTYYETDFPVRAFRTASRTFVETGAGPSKVKASSKAKAASPRGLMATLQAQGISLTSKAKQDRPVDAKRAALIEKLEAKLRNR